MTELRSWRLVIDWAPMVPSNRWHGGHWSKKAGLVEEWRNAALQAARIARLPKDLTGFTMEAQARLPKGQLPDFDAFGPACKAIVDGLVTGRNAGKPNGPGKVHPTGYGLTRDDSSEYVHGITLLPAIRDEHSPACLVLMLTESKESSCRVL